MMWNMFGPPYRCARTADQRRLPGADIGLFAPLVHMMSNNVRAARAPRRADLRWRSSRGPMHIKTLSAFDPFTRTERNRVRGQVAQGPLAVTMTCGATVRTLAEGGASRYDRADVPDEPHATRSAFECTRRLAAPSSARPPSP